MTKKTKYILLTAVATAIFSSRAFAENHWFLFKFPDDVSRCNTGRNAGTIKLYNHDDGMRWVPLLSITPGQPINFEYWGHFPYKKDNIAAVTPDGTVLSRSLKPGDYDITCESGKYKVQQMATAKL